MIFKVEIKDSVPFCRNMETDQGWKLVRDAEIRNGAFSVQPRPLLVSGEERIEFEEVLRRKGKQGLFGQKHAEAILAKVTELPPEWQKFHILFPDTVWKGFFSNTFDSIAGLHMLYPGVWELYFRWVGHGFTSCDYILDTV